MQVTRRMTSRAMPECFTVCADDFGDFAEGRWACPRTDIKRLKPPGPPSAAAGMRWIVQKAMDIDVGSWLIYLALCHIYGTSGGRGAA
jgi:hypothetical protein